MLWLSIPIGLGVLLAGFAAVVAARPSGFRVTRSATFAAPPAAVFAQVNNFRLWDDWSPWAKKDPKMTQTYDGPPAGVGAVNAWDGNGNVGAGQMTITESKPNELIRIKLEFFRPFKGVNDTEFTFTPQGSGTALTWTMTGRSNFVVKAFGMFMDMDKMIGNDFEAGLAGIKARVEK